MEAVAVVCYWRTGCVYERKMMLEECDWTGLCVIANVGFAIKRKSQPLWVSVHASLSYSRERKNSHWKEKQGKCFGVWDFVFAVVPKKWHYPQIIPGSFTLSLIRPLKSLTLSQWIWFYSRLPSPPALWTPALDNFVSLGEKAAAGRAALQGCCRAVQGTGSH